RLVLAQGRVAVALAALDLAAGRPAARTRVALQQALPALDGARLRVHVVEVTYPPGGASAPHAHPCPVVGHVVRGAFRTRVADGPEVVVRAGESFYEAPGVAHTVSANASATEPVTFTATFVCDREGPLSIPSPGTR
ncbi:cupin domain-containing protein, partial [Roseisolibacter sp. H3M3-2]|uniref:cupin domain-containing protein n=1 Tax=Roseisolibacter sp. H3M3-2 TaxID=3031323 RepID=UPI0023DBE5FE